MKSWTGVRGRVWATPGRTGRGKKTWTWHYEVTRPDGETVLYDNTGDWWLIYSAAAIRVEALQHMVIAGHKLGRYKG